MDGGAMWMHEDQWQKVAKAGRRLGTYGGQG